MESCINCRYSKKIIDDDNEMMMLNCVRYAPRPASIEYTDDIDQPMMYAIWPLVADNEWCGEYITAPQTHNKTTDRKH